MGRHRTTPAFASSGRWSQPNSGRSAGPNQIGVGFKPSLPQTASAVDNLLSSGPCAVYSSAFGSIPTEVPEVLTGAHYGSGTARAGETALMDSLRRPTSSRPDAGPHARRPGIGVEPVSTQQGERDPLDTKADRRGVALSPFPQTRSRNQSRNDRRRSSWTEAMAVGSASGSNGADDLVLERLRALVRGEHPPGAPEEGVVRDDRVDGETEPRQQIHEPLEPRRRGGRRRGRGHPGTRTRAGGTPASWQDQGSVRSESSVRRSQNGDRRQEGVRSTWGREAGMPRSTAPCPTARAISAQFSPRSSRSRSWACRLSSPTKTLTEPSRSGNERR